MEINEVAKWIMSPDSLTIHIRGREPINLRAGEIFIVRQAIAAQVSAYGLRDLQDREIKLYEHDTR